MSWSILLIAWLYITRQAIEFSSIQKTKQKTTFSIANAKRESPIFFGIIVLWNCKLAYKDSNWIQAFQGFLPPNFGVIYFCWLENWRAWKNIESGCCWGTSRWRPWWRKRWTKRRQRLGGLHLNPLHPYISMHILHTDLSLFLMVLTRRICLTIKSFLSCRSFSLFLWH